MSGLTATDRRPCLDGAWTHAPSRHALAGCAPVAALVPLARQIVTLSVQKFTFASHLRAPAADIVEHEGGGWCPTLDWVGVRVRRLARTGVVRGD